MNDTVRAMLQMVEDYERSQCQALGARARDEAARHVREAQRAARARMHRHIQELKQLRERSQNRARAEYATAERQVHRHRDQALLSQAWPHVVEALRQRWVDAAARQRWCDAVFARARQVLTPGAWRVSHPLDWVVAEQQRAAAGAAGRLEFIADPAIVAGLRVCANGACVDGTLAALLGDRAAVEARLLTLVAER